MNKKLRKLIIFTIFIILSLLLSINTKIFAGTIIQQSTGEVDVKPGGTYTFYASALTMNNNFYCTEPGVSNNNGGVYTVSEPKTATGDLATALQRFCRQRYI